MLALINFEFANEFKSQTGIECFPLKPYSRLASPVSSHADMLFCILDNVVFCYEDYAVENGLIPAIEDRGYKVMFVSKKCDPVYPNDVALNVLVMGKTLFCNKKTVAKEVVDYASKNGYSVVNVKQGYSACSALAVDENNVITSDTGMAEVLRANGKNVLLVSNDEIILKGYDKGFFGGASCVVGKTVYLFGKLEKLKDKNEILEFVSRVGVNIFQISADGVYDFGGAKLIF